MATNTKLKPGHWWAQVPYKRSYANETLLRREDARRWGIATEHRIGLGEPLSQRTKVESMTFGDLIDLYIEDVCEVGKAPCRSKAFMLEALREKPGRVKINDPTRERLIQFGKDSAKEGAGPPILSIDISCIKLIITHAVAVHGIGIKFEPVDFARIALKHLRLIGKSAYANATD